MKILFMCVANSARSQLAEGLAKKIFGAEVWIESAGSEPKFVNPVAQEVLAEVGVDISKNKSKSYEDLEPAFVDGLNYIITLCAEEVCPVMASKTAKRLHWPFPDPAGKSDILSEQLKIFRKTMTDIDLKIKEFKNSLAA